MGTNVVVAKEKPATPIYSYEIGDEITYDGEQYYVLKDSDSSSDYVVTLKKDPLIPEKVNAYSTSYVSQDGEYPYYESDPYNENNQSGCI